MATSITSSNITSTIPSSGDPADIVVAFTQYHANLAANLAGITLNGNVTPTSNANGKVTVSQANSTSYTGVGRIIVQSTQPTAPISGDIWMW